VKEVALTFVAMTAVGAPGEGLAAGVVTVKVEEVGPVATLFVALTVKS